MCTAAKWHCYESKLLNVKSFQRQELEAKCEHDSDKNFTKSYGKYQGWELRLDELNESIPEKVTYVTRQQLQTELEPKICKLHLEVPYNHLREQ